MITDTQKSALLWLKNRQGGGVFNRYNRLLACGELAPVTRSTWRKLESNCLVESYINRHIKLTRAGAVFPLDGVEERRGCLNGKEEER